MTEPNSEAPEQGDGTAAKVVAHRLHVDAHGKLQGNAWITYNSPFPCVNGQMGLVPPMRGVLMHTNVGSLPGTIATFNDPNREASAHFEVGGPWSGTVKNGRARIHQFGPVNGWMAWHCEDGNNMWFGTEHEDGGDPNHPLTDEQMTASAQILEALSAHAKWGFPLQVTDNPAGHGYGAHYIGGQAYGGHTCPDNPPGGQGPRSHQRAEIVRRAKILREHGQYPAAAPKPAAYVHLQADGKTSLAALAAAHNTAASSVLRLTAEHGPSAPEFSPAEARWVNAVFAGTASPTDPVPAGITLVVPGA